MAKKKEIVINPKTAPAAVTPGDVNIYYHHTLIGSLSEDGNARLTTENTVCEHDIGVEYTKPAAGNTLIPVTVNNLSSNPYVNLMLDGGAAIKTVNGNLILIPGGESDVNDIEYIIPDFLDLDDNYALGFYILDPFQELDATINNVPADYSDGRHYLIIETATYPESVIINITNKTT